VGRAVDAELHQHFVPSGHDFLFSVYKQGNVHSSFRMSPEPAKPNLVEFTLTAPAKDDVAAYA
jgi:hypothetical protein